MCTQQLLSKTASPATFDCEIDVTNNSAHTDGNRAAAVIFSVKYRQDGDYRIQKAQTRGGGDRRGVVDDNIPNGNEY